MAENRFLYLEKYKFTFELDSLDIIRTFYRDIYRRNRIRIGIISCLELLLFSITFALIGLWYNYEPNKLIPISLIIYTVFRILFRLTHIVLVVQKFKRKSTDLFNKKKTSKTKLIYYILGFLNWLLLQTLMVIWVYTASPRPLSILLLVLSFIYLFLIMYVLYNIILYIHSRLTSQFVKI